MPPQNRAKRSYGRAFAGAWRSRGESLNFRAIQTRTDGAMTSKDIARKLLAALPRMPNATPSEMLAEFRLLIAAKKVRARTH